MFDLTYALDTLLMFGSGLIPAIPTYFIAHKVYINKFTRQKQEQQGVIAPTFKQKSLSKKKTLSVVETNHQKWVSLNTGVPFIQDATKILETMVSLSSLQLSTQEQHDLEVLSNQTDSLLTGYFNTPENIRNMPEVRTALETQLVEIVKNVNNIQAQGASTIVRELTNGTEFLKLKFKES